MLPRRALTQKWAVGMHSEDIRWDLYPQVARTPQARGFVVRLQQFSRRPKTIDAYARNLDRYLASFVDAPSARWVEADEGTLLTYLDDLRSGRTRQAASQRRPLPANVVFLTGSRAASTRWRSKSSLARPNMLRSSSLILFTCPSVCP